MRVSGARTRVLLCLVLVFASVTSVLRFDTSYAAQITNRSLTLKQHTGTTTGGSAPGGVADHAFTFTIPTNTSIGSIQFNYCTTPTGSCTMPTGLVTTASTLSGLSGNITGWTLTNGTNGAPYITSTPAATTGVTTATVANVTNPTAANTTFFVRITTFTSTNATTGSTDSGVVAASTTTTIVITGVMPEYLQFCTGGTITGTNCGSATAGTISFNQDFSSAATATATSMMTAATNGSFGYAITVTGTTLTSGSNTIPAIGTSSLNATTSQGTSKFGLNLVANTTPSVGAAISPASNGTDLRALPTTAYSTANSFALDLTGATAIANSDNTTPGTSAPSNLQTYTVSYIANVSGIQQSGTYVATLNFVCTPTF